MLGDIRKDVCRWCGQEFEYEVTLGRPPEFCSLDHYKLDTRNRDPRRKTLQLELKSPWMPCAICGLQIKQKGGVGRPKKICGRPDCRKRAIANRNERARSHGRQRIDE